MRKPSREAVQSTAASLAVLIMLVLLFLLWLIGPHVLRANLHGLGL